MSPAHPWLGDTAAVGPDLPWGDLAVCVAGIRTSGIACAQVLAGFGARVTVVDDADDDKQRAVAAELAQIGVTTGLGPAAVLPEGTDLVVTSPGWRPTSRLFAAAAAAGVPVWGEPELAWRLRPHDGAPWLVVTGTDGKTTTTMMLAAMLNAGGRRSAPVGNTGVPLVETVLGRGLGADLDVLAVELGSFQLHWSPSVAPQAAAIVNIAQDHLDWHGSFEAYVEAKGRAYAHAQVAVGNADDPVTTRLIARAPGRRVTFTLDAPRPRQLGVAGGVLLDRAFVPDPDDPSGAVELARTDDIPVTGAHNVANALAAAALARAHGVAPEAIADGLRAFVPARHRNALVATIGGVTYVDDSKATSPHAAAASLAAYPSIVWIAGGLGKGLPYDDVVAQAAARLRGAVLIGACRDEIRGALARHAPEVPVREVVGADTDDVESVMARVIRVASDLASAGDTVLLAPAAASMDMFRDYGHRGDAFAEAVNRLARVSGEAAG